MSLFHQNILAGASGAGGAAGGPLYVDDVYSTFAYDGGSSARTITNGIDLDGEGGLVWIKRRDGADPYVLQDTERGTGKFLRSNSSAAQSNAGTARVSAFNSDGFSVGTDSQVNFSSQTYVSWTFRKAPGFFDVVTYTGDASGGSAVRSISHNLGSAPGMVVVKCTSDTTFWSVWHRSAGLSYQQRLRLDENGTIQSGEKFWGNSSTAPDMNSSTFSVGTSDQVNGSGRTYVAYLFAHDDQSFGTDSDEAIIKCGSYTGNGSSYGTFQDLGFEPQWILIKPSSGVTDHWSILDNMRGAVTGAPSNGTDKPLHPNEDIPEQSDELIEFNSTGFTPRGSDDKSNANSATYIYVAIRRPHKPPEAGTDVYTATAYTGAGGNNRELDINLVADMIHIKSRNWTSTTANNIIQDRLRGLDNSGLKTNSTSPEGTDTYLKDISSSDGIITMGTNHEVNENTYLYIANAFKRAPGFFDMVAYTGTGSATTINHNLGAVPSVVLIKQRNATRNWYWQHYALGANTWLQLNKDEDQASNGTLFSSTLPTSSVFSVSDLGGVNASGNYYIAYLFGDLDGISKAGTYTGTGSNINVDCGFTAGARFVMIKRADSSGDWYYWDTARGIVSGNDPYLRFNVANTEVGGNDYIDPLNSGFTVTSSAPADLNASGGTYIFLAIA